MSDIVISSPSFPASSNAMKGKEGDCWRLDPLAKRTRNFELKNQEIETEAGILRTFPGFYGLRGKIGNRKRLFIIISILFRDQKCLPGCREVNEVSNYFGVMLPYAAVMMARAS